MTRLILVSTLLMLLLLPGCLTPEERPDQLQAIARWQDLRLAPADSLRAAVTDDDAHVRLAAVRAAGLIGRDDVLPQIIDALADASLTVRAEAAWALGLIGDPLALPDLNRAAADIRPQVRDTAVAALGHLANDGTALLIAADHDSPTTAALAWNSLRNRAAEVAAADLRAAIITGLKRPEADVRWRVLRCAEMVKDSTLVPILAPYVLSDHDQVVVHAYRALGQQSGPQVLPAVLAGFEHHKDFRGRMRDRVTINACRAVGALGAAAMSTAAIGTATPTKMDDFTAEFIAAELITAAGDDNPHVSATALSAMARLVADLPLPAEAAQQESLLPVWRIRLARAARSHLDKPQAGVRAAAVAAYAAVRGAGASKELQVVIELETVPQVLAAAMTAVAAYHPMPGLTLSAHCAPRFNSPHALKSGRPINAMVRSAALTGLNDVRLKRPAAAIAPFDRNHIEGKLLTAATDGDFVVSTTAAGLLGSVHSDEALLALTSLWDRAQGPGKAEIRRGVLTGLSEMFSQDTGDIAVQWQPAAELQEEARRVLRESFDSADIRIRNEGRQAAMDSELLPAELIPTAGSLAATLPAVRRDHRQPPVVVPFDAPKILCVSERGTFTIALDGELAPNTCALFLSLIRDDYFGAMNFHRVVPDFVVQGGDPQGNGWGGPGFTTRSEWSRARYDRAAVGIAHDGKDTGGSQFFVTLSPQPHLNARYTIFGWVSKGMDVVDRIEVGDTFRLELAE